MTVWFFHVPGAKANEYTLNLLHCVFLFLLGPLELRMQKQNLESMSHVHGLSDALHCFTHSQEITLRLTVRLLKMARSEHLAHTSRIFQRLKLLSVSAI